MSERKPDSTICPVQMDIGVSRIVYQKYNSNVKKFKRLSYSMHAWCAGQFHLGRVLPGHHFGSRHGAISLQRMHNR